MEKFKEIKKADFVARTQLPWHTYTFKWVLECFSKLDSLNSLEFYTGKGNYWYLHISKNVCKINYLRMFRTRGEGNVQINCHIYYAGSNGEVLFNCRSSHYYYNPSQFNDLNKEVLIKEDDLEKLNDVVELTILFELSDTTVTVKSDPLPYYFPPENEFQLDVQKSLSDDLQNLFESHMNTDLTLSIDGETLQVHKLILSARSPVFANMFRQEMAESTNNIVIIEDIKMTAMKEVIAFMYGRVKSDYDYDTAFEVYYTADKYDVQKLKEVCGAVLASQLNEKNAGDVLNASDRHQDKVLKQRVMNFIISNLKSCVITEWWGVLMNNKSDLAAEVATFISQFK